LRSLETFKIKLEVESQKSYKYIHFIFPRGRKLDLLVRLPMVWLLIWALEVDGMYELSHGPFIHDLWMSQGKSPLPLGYNLCQNKDSLSY
jgi:hypothetical protein